MPFQPNFFAANPKSITGAEALALKNARNAYDYPYTRMISSGAKGDIELAPGEWATFDISKKYQATDLSLDDHHRDLLKSVNPTEQLLGIASIIYWGFFTFTDNYARKRVERFLKGYKTKPGTTPAMAAQVVRISLQQIHPSPHLGDVLGCCHGISQLGRTPFASKFVAFLLPDFAGVYDNRLNKALSARTWSQGAAFIGAIGNVRAGNVRTGYHDWCVLLQSIAHCLNTGINAGRAWHWTSQEQGLQRWRALDVERALFYLVA